METLFGSIRYALRQFRLAPVFTLAAVLTLRGVAPPAPPKP